MSINMLSQSPYKGKYLLPDINKDCQCSNPIQKIHPRLKILYSELLY